jgi:hypothetical protein
LNALLVYFFWFIVTSVLSIVCWGWLGGWLFRICAVILGIGVLVLGERTARAFANCIQPSDSYIKQSEGWIADEHTDDENVKWCWLRSVEWGHWPAYLSQLYVPILFIYYPWFKVLIAIAIINALWAFVRYRFVSTLSAWLAAVMVGFTRWPIALAGAAHLFFHGQRVASGLALFWPILAGIYVLPPVEIGRMQRLFLAKIGRASLWRTHSIDLPADDTEQVT